jgi:hypothetical protein
MKVISFDVGIRNMAFCICNVENAQVDILDWKIKDFGKNISVTPLLPRLTTWLLETFGDKEWDFVLIENQVGSSMRCLQTAIHMFFETQRQLYGFGEVCSVAAALKLRGSDVLGTTYKKRKDYSVDYITNKLKFQPEWFMALKKKDDLCDSLLQCIKYFQYHSFLGTDYDLCVQE